MSSDQKSKPKSKKELDEDERLRGHARWMYGAEIFYSLARWIIFGAFGLAVVYTGVYLPVQASAGKETTITVFYQWLFDANLHVYIAWGAAGCCGAYALTERSKRLKERKEKDERIQAFEQDKDKKRETSGVTTEGEALQR